ncbi:adenylyltransferase/cytidyltransferase family protein [Candidatus Parcubacteria bacterium]|nr:adenylyltransferase/cytidyltransferase family protein [Candidatus Parcubacteria bacterium]
MATRALAFGTFDGLHEGHVFFLRMARSFGDALFVAVARDAQVRALKGHEPRLRETERLDAVAALGFVDDVRLCDEGLSTFGILDDVNPDVIVLGHDQQELESALRAWMQTHRHIPIRSVEEVETGRCAHCSCGN